MKQNLKPLLMLVLLTAGYLVFVAGSSSQLPQRVAIHFDINGLANNWIDRSHAVVFFETLAGLPVLFAVISFLINVLPAWSFNLPNRDYWLAPERRPKTVAWISGHLAWMGCLNAVFLAGIYWLTLQANSLKPARLPVNLFLPMVGVFLAVVGVWILRFHRHFSKRYHR